MDTDGDRHPEPLLVADFGTSRYFKNLGDGSFVDHTEKAGVGLEWSGMGTAISDFDRDGRVDWFATAIFDDEAAARADGNKLYLNQGDHRFVEVAVASGVDDGGWGWGTAAVDLDLDGRLDLVEVNGWGRPAYENEMAQLVPGGAGHLRQSCPGAQRVRFGCPRGHRRQLPARPSCGVLLHGPVHGPDRVDITPKHE